MKKDMVGLARKMMLLKAVFIILMLLLQPKLVRDNDLPLPRACRFPF